MEFFAEDEGTTETNMGVDLDAVSNASPEQIDKLLNDLGLSISCGCNHDECEVPTPPMYRRIQVIADAIQAAARTSDDPAEAQQREHRRVVALLAESAPDKESVIGLALYAIARSNHLERQLRRGK